MLTCGDDLQLVFAVLLRAGHHIVDGICGVLEGLTIIFALQQVG